jgi:hypothetical protein
MDLNYLLSRKAIDTKNSKVLVMRHVPTQPGVRRALPWLAADKPEVFNAYQQSQTPKAEKQLMQAAYLVSFIGHEPGEAVFVGVYRVAGHKPISYDQFMKKPANGVLRGLGVEFFENDSSPHIWFDLELTDTYEDWKGKLILAWPPPGIAWTRWADRNEFPVKAILEENMLVKAMPGSDELGLTWGELDNLPRSWVHTLCQWRGIYFILDGADGKGYVGSAYGEKNLYGRWKNYAEKGDGGNKLLRDRAPDKFRFSILELVSPTETQGEVCRREKNWKERLHTREFGLNAN